MLTPRTIFPNPKFQRTAFPLETALMSIYSWSHPIRKGPFPKWKSRLFRLLTEFQHKIYLIQCSSSRFLLLKKKRKEKKEAKCGPLDAPETGVLSHKRELRMQPC